MSQLTLAPNSGSRYNRHHHNKGIHMKRRKINEWEEDGLDGAMSLCMGSSHF